MGLTKCTVAADVIGSLGTTVAARGLTTQQFKDAFDQMPEGLKAYLNDVLTAELDALETAKTSAWTAYTPTLTVSSGTLTSASTAGRYKQIGKTVYLSIDVVVTTNGTASGEFRASLPVAPKTGASFICAGRENAIAGKMLQGKISGSSYVAIYDYANAYPGANGAAFVISGVYEAN